MFKKFNSCLFIYSHSCLEYVITIFSNSDVLRLFYLPALICSPVFFPVHICFKQMDSLIRSHKFALSLQTLFRTCEVNESHSVFSKNSEQLLKSLGLEKQFQRSFSCPEKLNVAKVLYLPRIPNL